MLLNNLVIKRIKDFIKCVKNNKISILFDTYITFIIKNNITTLNFSNKENIVELFKCKYESKDYTCKIEYDNFISIIEKFDSLKIYFDDDKVNFINNNTKLSLPTINHHNIELEYDNFFQFSNLNLEMFIDIIKTYKDDEHKFLNIKYENGKITFSTTDKISLFYKSYKIKCDNKTIFFKIPLSFLHFYLLFNTNNNNIILNKQSSIIKLYYNRSTVKINIGGVTLYSCIDKNTFDIDKLLNKYNKFDHQLVIKRNNLVRIIKDFEILIKSTDTIEFNVKDNSLDLTCFHNTKSIKELNIDCKSKTCFKFYINFQAVKSMVESFKGSMVGIKFNVDQNCVYIKDNLNNSCLVRGIKKIT